MAILICFGAPTIGFVAGQEPELLRSGQSKNGVSVRSDGKILFKDEVLGYIVDANAAQATLSPPSSKKGLVYVNHSDFDWGGLQGSIVDPSKGLVVVRSILPNDRIRGRGKAEKVIQVCGEISWSPNEDYAIIAQCGEVQRNIVVINLLEGLSHIKEIGDLRGGECDWQYFEKGTWVTPSIYKFRVVLQKYPWPVEKPCEAKRFYPAYDLSINAEDLEVKQ